MLKTAHDIKKNIHFSNFTDATNNMVLHAVESALAPGRPMNE